MSIPEQISAWLAVLIEFGLVGFFVLQPEYRLLTYLLPAGLVGVAANTALLFLVFRDIWLRPFATPKTKFVWGATIFIFMPAAVLYLLRHGRNRR